MGAVLLLTSTLLLLASGQANESQERKARPWQGARACPLNDSQDLSFFVVGDWGRGGQQQQRMVAALMSAQAESCFKPKWIVSTGDNFYNHGLRGPHDPYFNKTFTAVYTAPSLMVPFYAVLGNHDYGEFGGTTVRGVGGCLAIDFHLCPSHCCYSATWQDTFSGPLITGRESLATFDSRWNLKQGAWKKSEGSLLDIIFIDTTPFMMRYKHSLWANMSGGLARQNPRKQLADVQNLLRNSSASWKIVVGHHPIKSYGEHCEPDLPELETLHTWPRAMRKEYDCLDMQFLKPVLEEYKVDVYMSGHDHGIQLIKEPGFHTHYLVSGAGSTVKRGRFRGMNTTDALFLVDQPGFVAVSIKSGNLRMDMFSVRSPVHLFSMTLQKQRQV